MRLLAIVLVFALLAGIVPGTPARAAGVSDYDLYYSNYNTEAVVNGIDYYPGFQVKDEDLLVQSVTTYHWNDGYGSPPGTISIYNWDDELIGTWNAVGRDGDVNWDIFPNIVLRAGQSYYITDSDEATWSSNARSSYIGFVEVRGKAAQAANTRSLEGKLTYRGIRIVIDGEEIVPTDVQGNETMPFIYNDSTYLPVRAVAGALGLSVGWDNATSTVSLTSGAVRTARYGTAGTQYYSFTGKLTWRGISIEVDGTRITPKDALGNVVEPFIYNDSTYLPVRALANALGLTVGWDNDTSTVDIRSGGGSGSSGGISGGSEPGGIVDDDFGSEHVEFVDFSSLEGSGDDVYVDPGDDTLRKVTPEEPKAVFLSGVEVDFGEDGLVSPEKVQVLDRGSYSEGPVSYHEYDFSLGDGGFVELSTLVTVSVPCEDPANAFVEVYEDGEWVPLYSEPSADGTKLVFYPEHFTPYRVGFWVRVKNWLAPGSQPIFCYLDEKPTPNSVVFMNKAALNARLDSAGDVNALLNSARSSQYVDLAFDFYGYASDSLGAYVAMKDLLKDYSSMEGLSDKLSAIGSVATFARIGYQAYNSGSVLTALQKNALALMKMASDYALKRAGTAAAATAYSVSNVLYAVYEFGAALGSWVDWAMKLGGSSEEEYAYRRFTLDYVALNAGTRKAVSAYDSANPGLPAENTLIKYGYREAGYYRLAAVNSVQKSAGAQVSWAELIRTISAGVPEDQPEVCLERLNEALNEYCTAFWRLKEADRIAYLRNNTTSNGRKSLSSVWKEPTPAEKEAYARKFKAEIISANKAVFEQLTKKAIQKMRNLAIQEAKRMQNYLCEKVTFTLRDPAVNDFADSVYAGADIRIRQDAFTGEEDFRFSKENGYRVTCTRYAWLLASRSSASAYVDVVMPEGGKFSFPFTFTDPVTEITLADDRQTFTTSMSCPDGTMRFTVTGGHITSVGQTETSSGGHNTYETMNPFDFDWFWEESVKPLRGELKQGEPLTLSTSCASATPIFRLQFDGVEQQIQPSWVMEDHLTVNVPEGVSTVTVTCTAYWDHEPGFFDDDTAAAEVPNRTLCIKVDYTVVDKYSSGGLTSAP